MISGWLIRSQLAEVVSLDRADMLILRDDVAGFVFRSKRCAPMHVRLGLCVLEIAFAGLVLAAACPRPESQRGRALTRLWSRLPDPAPNLVRFYASMTALRSFEHPILRRRFGFPNLADRVDRKRAERALSIGTAP